jgi:hypothetical protein
MFTVGATVQLWMPTVHKNRVLIPGKIENLLDGGSVVVARFEEPTPIPVGTDAQLYIESRGKFYQQGVTVRSIESQDIEVESSKASAPFNLNPQIELTRVGDPVSAESRGSYRVQSTLSGISATVAKSKQPFQVVDVSPEGFALLMPAAPAVGSMLHVSWTYGDITVNGEARVQTIKKTRGGDIRVGFLLPDKASPARKALAKASLALQRDQLRRQSRAA